MLKNALSWLNCIKSIVKYGIILLIGIYIGYSLPKESEVITVTKIETRDSIIRDSIYIINDSIKVIINNIEKEYVKEDSMLNSLDDSSHVSFFTRYIENYKRTH
jgi:hypothetical protein